MNLLETLLTNSLVMTLGWTLIHFIWQGVLIAIMLAGIQAVLSRHSANARYAAACIAMLVMLAAPLATMITISLSKSEETSVSSQPVFAARSELQTRANDTARISGGTLTGASTVSALPWLPNRTESLMGWMILVWLSGVIFFALRLTGGWFYIRSLPIQGTRPLNEPWQEALHRLCGQLGMRRTIRLLESTVVKAPMAIGWLRPAILLPVEALTGLTQGQVEAIIAHELAHIRRHDYIVNLLQVVIETFFFYHPAVWWVSRRIRHERENYCDDVAVALCGNVLTYARALMEMEQLRLDKQRLAVAANGESLMSRIQRITRIQPQRTNRFAVSLGGVIVIITLASIIVGARILIPFLNHDDLKSHHQVASVGKQPDGASFPGGTSAGWSVAKSRQPDRNLAQNNNPFEALSFALQYPSWQVRKAAVERLAQLDDSRSFDLLVIALGDGHQQVREQAVIGLGARDDERVTRYLANALSDGDWPVREQAAIALGKRRDERAGDFLLTALTDNEWQVREQAARSLGVIKDQRAIDPLINALTDQNSQVREAAAKSLGLLGDNRALESLERALQDVDEEVQRKAAEALRLLRVKGESSNSAVETPEFEIDRN
jgi:beta-lactamase regulating signal transducer with metallopeptidase domain